MRCTKCGYDGAGNVPGGTCIKCGTRLNNDGGPQPITQVASFQNEGSDPQSRPTMIGMNVSEMDLRATRIGEAPEPLSKNQLKQTVIQGGIPIIGVPGKPMKSTVAQNPSLDPGLVSGPLQFEDSDDLHCPKCGYPLADHYSSCPNCGFDFNGEDEEEPIKEEPKPKPSSNKNSSTSKKKKKNEELVPAGTVGLSAIQKEKSDENDVIYTCEECGAEISAAFSFCPKCGAKIRPRTLQGIHHHKKKVKEVPEEAPAPTVIMSFNLTIIPEDDEVIEPEINHFEGAETILNRGNTEPDNRTITSKEQAVVIYEDGKWYIENRSEHNPTLILANRKMEIQTGDIIMLGDRRFRFESEETSN